MLKGYIINKFSKTSIVQVKRIKKHSRYKKYLHIFVKYMIHDFENTSDIGDYIEFRPSRPYSKKKKWILSKIIIKKDTPGNDSISNNT